MGAGAEPQAPGGAWRGTFAAGGARVRPPHRLRDGPPLCLLGCVAAGMGPPRLAVIAGDLVDPLPPVDVRGRTAPLATSGWHNAIDATERQDAVGYLRLADDGWSDAG